MNKLRNIPLFAGGIFQQEYEGPDYGYENYELITTGNFEWIDFPLKTNYKFDAFIDGTMKLYWIGNAAKSGTPLFYASVAVALLYRTSDKFLRNTTYTRNINLLIFPFLAYREAFPVDFGKQVEEFIQNLKQDFQRIGIPIYTEDEIRDKYRSIENVFSQSDVWIVSDISLSGIISENRKRQIDENNLGKFSEIKKKARARARQYMRLLEFFALKAFKERNPNSLVMVDGLFTARRHVKKHFLITDSDYDEITKGVVGFIKRPMEIPHDIKNIYEWWERLVPGKAVIWEGNLKEKNEENTSQTEKPEPYKFALMRFRYFRSFQVMPAGVVKIQVNSSTDIEEYKHLLSAIYRERLPFVTFPKRSLNEPYPIEAAEKVAKSFFPQEEIIRGFLSRYIPEVPYLYL